MLETQRCGWQIRTILSLNFAHPTATIFEKNIERCNIYISHLVRDRNGIFDPTEAIQVNRPRLVASGYIEIQQAAFSISNDQAELLG